jgi:hypothetical protein
MVSSDANLCSGGAIFLIHTTHSHIQTHTHSLVFFYLVSVCRSACASPHLLAHHGAKIAAAPQL